MAGIANDVKQIRQALYGREVREAIAHGIEQCYSDVTASKTVADTAAAAANTATQNAQTATQQANQARDNAQAVADGVVNQSITAINDVAAQQRQSVNDLGGQLKSYMSEHYSETITKAEAKANRSSVSTIKHATGTDGQLTLTDALNEPAKKMTIHLEPKQDLHGYNKPWIGGTGKNLYPIKIDADIFISNQDGFVTKPGDGSIIIGTTKSGTSATGCYFESNPSSGSQLYYLTKNASGPYVISFDAKSDDGVILRYGTSDDITHYATLSSSWKRISYSKTEATTRPVCLYMSESVSGKTMTIRNMQFEYGTVASPYEPYDNICSVDGYDSIQTVSVGKNLINLTPFSKSISGINFICDGSTLEISGENPNSEAATDSNLASGYSNIPGPTYPAGTYTIWSEGFTPESARDADRIVINVRYPDGSFVVKGTRIGGIGAATKLTFTATNVFRVGVFIYIAPGGSYNQLVRVQMEKGSTKTSYEPYHGNTVSINLVSSAGSTVYGGTVTVNEDGSGTLIVDRKSHTITGDEPGWGASSVSNSRILFYANVSGMRQTTDSITCCNCGIVSSAHGSGNELRASGRSNTYGFVISIPASLVGLNGSSSTQEMIDNAKEFVKNNSIQIICFLADQLVYQLTASQLQTIAGTNHVWTDGANIELDYYGDKYCTYEQVMELIANALRS